MRDNRSELEHIFDYIVFYSVLAIAAIFLFGCGQCPKPKECPPCKQFYDEDEETDYAEYNNNL